MKELTNDRSQNMEKTVRSEKKKCAHMLVDLVYICQI